jgi:DNA-binding transcriptional ArsR family regulator
VIVVNNFLPVLKILADETRFKIISLLLTHDLCVGALAGRLDISEAAVSQHLQILRKAGLVKGEKRGYWTHYSVERNILNQLAEELKKLADPTGYRYVCERESSGNINISERGEKKMCQCNCEHPEKLKGKPGECSPEQIQECHGNEKDHACKEEKK